MSANHDGAARTMKTTMADVQHYWQDAAASERDAQGLRPTARDPYLQEAVEAAMLKWLAPGRSVLDVGCGDGLSTIRFARAVRSIVGVDYIDSFVERARRNAAASDVRNVEFLPGSVLDLSASLGGGRRFDTVTTIRCLINLPEWTLQASALEQIAQVLEPGGLYLLSEGWEEGWSGLNRLRQRIGKPPLSLVRYNRLINREQFEKEALRFFDVVHYESLGFYIFMSRVFQPLYVEPAEPRHDHDINRVAAALLSQGLGQGIMEECDYAGVYVLRRR
jgi:ubiquinone/menaquinone biosynthesis C-methylase UbiE